MDFKCLQTGNLIDRGEPCATFCFLPRKRLVARPTTKRAIRRVSSRRRRRRRGRLDLTTEREFFRTYLCTDTPLITGSTDGGKCTLNCMYKKKKKNDNEPAYLRCTRRGPWLAVPRSGPVWVRWGRKWRRWTGARSRNAGSPCRWPASCWRRTSGSGSTTGGRSLFGDTRRHGHITREHGNAVGRGDEKRGQRPGPRDGGRKKKNTTKTRQSPTGPAAIAVRGLRPRHKTRVRKRRKNPSTDRPKCRVNPRETRVSLKGSQRGP